MPGGPGGRGGCPAPQPRSPAGPGAARRSGAGAGALRGHRPPGSAAPGRGFPRGGCRLFSPRLGHLRAFRGAGRHRGEGGGPRGAGVPLPAAPPRRGSALPAAPPAGREEAGRRPGGGEGPPRRRGRGAAGLRGERGQPRPRSAGMRVARPGRQHQVPRGWRGAGPRGVPTASGSRRAKPPRGGHPAARAHPRGEAPAGRWGGGPGSPPGSERVPGETQPQGGSGASLRAPRSTRTGIVRSYWRVIWGDLQVLSSSLLPGIPGQPADAAVCPPAASGSPKGCVPLVSVVEGCLLAF